MDDSRHWHRDGCRQFPFPRPSTSRACGSWCAPTRPARLLDGQLAKAKPKRLRYRLLHVAARLAFSGRKAKLHLQQTWPWATELVEAFAKLKTLLAPAG
jgi:hypothetical protein